MNVDVQSLETFNQLARGGAEAASVSLSEMTGRDATVEITETRLMSNEDLEKELSSKNLVGVQIEMEGNLHGKNILLFERDTVEQIIDALAEATNQDELKEGETLDGLSQSGIEEVCNVMVGGFTKGWADFFDQTIDVHPPDMVDSVMSSVRKDEHVFLFESKIKFDHDKEFSLYMFPAMDTLMELVGDETGEINMEIEKMTVYNDMTRRGAGIVSDKLTQMSGINMEVQNSSVNFLEVDEISKKFDQNEKVALVFSFEGLPSGYVAILLDNPDALKLANTLTFDDEESEQLEKKHKDALKEIGNIACSGYIDGWANVLDTTIDISTPKLIQDSASSILDAVAVRIGHEEDYSFLIQSTLVGSDDDFECTILAMPRAEKLKEALTRLEVEEKPDLKADPTEYF